MPRIFRAIVGMACGHGKKSFLAISAPKEFFRIPEINYCVEGQCGMKVPSLSSIYKRLHGDVARLSYPTASFTNRLIVEF
ncbi:MAG: hypothetical protein ACLQO6_19235 [Desulfomonilaceae bacterium]